MKIKGIVLSSIIITSLLFGSPPDPSDEKTLDYGKGLLWLLQNPDPMVAAYGQVYIKGVAAGLMLNGHTIEFLSDMNPEFRDRVEKHTVLKIPEEVSHLEIIDVVHLYLVNHPGYLYYPSSILISNALFDVFRDIDDEDDG